MKKILFVIHTLGVGGAERSLVNLLNEMPKERYKIDLLLFKKRGVFLSQVPPHVHILEQPDALKKLYSPVQKAGVYLPLKVIGTAVSRICEKGTEARHAFRWRYFYGRAVRRLPEKYDVAVGYLGGESTDYVLDKVDAKKKIHWVHNDYRAHQMPKKYDREVFRRADAIVTISMECLDILKEEFPEYAGKCRCIANITSSKVIRKQAEEFYPAEFKNEPNSLLSVGRLSRQKGMDLAIGAAQILKERGKSFRWFILGEGEERERLERQIREKNVEDCVFLPGVMANPYPYIKNCRILIQPSRYEGKSVALDEAKILAKPIVATAYPTAGDQIQDGKEGLIAEMTPEGIAAKIIELLDTETLYESIREYLSSHEYGNQAEISKYLELFG